MLWRLHLRPAPQKPKTHEDVIAYCIDNGIAAIGWPIDVLPVNATDYAERAKKKYAKKPSATRFADEMQKGQLIWARDKSGIYYLGLIIGDWFYSNDPEHVQLDIPNQRACLWLRVGNEENVPGKIVACFRPRRTLQTVQDAGMELYSKWLFNTRKARVFADVALPHITRDAASFFRFIGGEDCEDIVGLYLQQTRGYILVPSSCKADTVGHEYILKRRHSHQTAVAQVKQGKIDLNPDTLRSADHVYLFSSEGDCGASSETTTVLTAQELFDFTLANPGLMPPKITYWLNFGSDEQALAA